MSRFLAFCLSGAVPPRSACNRLRSRSVCSAVQLKAQQRGFSKPPQQNVKLLACDMDGTMLNSKSNITNENIEAVQRLLEETGVHFIPATGKSRTGALRAMGRLGQYLKEHNPSGVPGVYCQGLVVYGRNGEIVFESGVEPDISSKIVQIAEELGLSLIAYSGDEIFSDKEDVFTQLLPSYHEPAVTALGDWHHAIGRRTLNKFIFMAEKERIDKIRPIVAEELESSAVSLTQAQGNMLEVLPGGTSKGAGLGYLIDAWGIDAGEVMALGDAENDVEMLRMVGFPCVVENATSHVYHMPSVTHVPSNDDSGVAYAIHQFLLP